MTPAPPTPPSPRFSSRAHVERNVRLDPQGIYGTRSARRQNQLRRRRQFQNGLLWAIGAVAIFALMRWALQPRQSARAARESWQLPFRPAAAPLILTPNRPQNGASELLFTSQSGGLWRARTGTNTGLTEPPRRVWSTALAPAGALLVTPKQIFWPGSDGVLVALDAATGRVQWRAALPSALVARPALARAGGRAVVIAGDDAGNIAAFDVQSGILQWKKSLGGALGEAIGVLDAQKSVADRNGTATGANPPTARNFPRAAGAIFSGDERASNLNGNRAEHEIGAANAAALANEIGSSAGNGGAIGSGNATGNGGATGNGNSAGSGNSTGNGSATGNGSVAGVAGAGGSSGDGVPGNGGAVGNGSEGNGAASGIVVPLGAGTATRGGLVCLDAGSGAVRWSFPGDARSQSAGFAAPAIWRNRVFWGNDEGAVVCLDGATGRKIWKNFAAPLLSSAVPSANSAASPASTSPSASASILPATSGLTAPAKFAATGDNLVMLRGAPLVIAAAGVVVLGGNDGVLRAFDLATGAPRWTQSLGGALHFAAQKLLFEGKNALLVGGEMPAIFLLDARDGTVLRRWTTPDNNSYGVAFTSQNAYSLDAAGRLQVATLQ